ncbi:MAG: hypothetical protein IPH88_06505 [Bacteroidales bacterium]|nr:hypothetical protein [Bacteroidales bacterium]
MKRLVRIETFNKSKGELILKSVFTYDKKGRITKERCYIVQFGQITGVSELKHTYTGNVEITIESTNPEDDYTNYILTTYDARQRPIETKSVNSTIKSCYWFKCVYDENDLLINKYLLDESGQTTRIIEHKSNNEKGATPSFNSFSQHLDYIKDDIFTYNEKGHWLSQLVLLNGKPSKYHERTIEYYYQTLFE